MQSPVIKNLGQPIYLLVMLGTALLLFDFNYYLMSTLPGSRDFACVVGANLTTGHIIFAGILSILAGIMAAGILALVRKNSSKFAVSSMSGIGLFFGGMTMFCTACTLPFISLFGLNIGLSFFTTYSLLFQITSLGLLGISVIFLNKKLNRDCRACRIQV
ncbi:hypothetical protein HYW82_02740 [Candidatus Peregrinibacteria bacterium]|nr:hypothetical protein [Candidatus Peregrinibacteria bacterium]